MENHINFKKVFKTAGAFMAWVIGSGFATGQEVLQFFFQLRIPQLRSRPLEPGWLHRNRLSADALWL